MHGNFDEVINRENTNSVKYDLRKQVFNNGTVIPMWVADMDLRTPEFIISALRQRLEHEILGYTFMPPSFIDAVVNWNKRRHNWNIHPSWISFSPGVVPALNLIMLAYSRPGDSIIIQPPVYFPFFSAVKNHNRKLITNPLKYANGQYTMDFPDLEAKITSQTRMLILSNPHNPTGNAWSVDVLSHLAEICLKKNILVISDEIHADLIYPGYRHVPVARLSDEIARNTVTCMSASKTFNLAGLSTAYLVIPDQHLKARYEKILDQIHVGAGNIFGFIAAEAAYTHGDDWLNRLMLYLQNNLRFLHEYLSKHVPMIKLVEPQATYLAWLDCSALGMKPDELQQFMIHTAGLGLNDGRQFGRGGEGFQRMNIACPQLVLHQALDKLKNAIDKYFAK